MDFLLLKITFFWHICSEHERNIGLRSSFGVHIVSQKLAKITKLQGYLCGKWHHVKEWSAGVAYGIKLVFLQRPPSVSLLLHWDSLHFFVYWVLRNLKPLAFTTFMLWFGSGAAAVRECIWNQFDSSKQRGKEGSEQQSCSFQVQCEETRAGVPQT